VAILSSSLYNDTGTVLEAQVAQNSDDITITPRAAGVWGTPIDLTTLLDSGDLWVTIAYLTDE
jgi:hypothetical protein